jgi:PIN domain nuclease of toxin-antitoxin system
MITAVADTHSVVWYLFGDARLSVGAREAIDGAGSSGNQVAVSSITLAELIYLIEKGRLDPQVLDRLSEALQADGVLVDAPFNQKVARAMQKVSRSQVPDLPDRIVAATAVYLGVPVISRDAKIQASEVDTIW